MASLSQQSSVIPLPTAPPVIDPKAPLDIAREFVRRLYHCDAVQILHNQNDTFYAWTGTHYSEIEESALRVKVYKFLDGAFRLLEEGTARVKPATKLINNVIDALKAEVHLGLIHLPPTWLYASKFAPKEIIPCQNGLLHLPSGHLLPHTPQFFADNVLQFDFNAQADRPCNG